MQAGAGEESQHSYPVVNAVSWRDKRCRRVQSWHKCYQSNQMFPQEEIHACFSQEPRTVELTGPRGELTILVMQNGDSFKLLSKFLSLFPYIIATPRPHWRNFFVQSTSVNRKILSWSKQREWVFMECLVTCIPWPIGSCHQSLVGNVYQQTLISTASLQGKTEPKDFRIQGREYWCGTVSSGHPRTTTLTNSQKLWLPAQDVCKVKTGNRARKCMEHGTRQHGGGVCEAPSAAEELLTADGCLRKESQLSLRVWPGYVNFALAGGPTLMSLCSTN